MYRIWTRGREVKSILASSTGSFDYNHYIRLFMLSGIDILITIPYNIWYLMTLATANILPWPGWNAIHNSNWSQILLVTLAVLRNFPQSLYRVQVPRWMYVVYGFIFFALFGISDEAMKRYWSAWQYVSKIFCWKTSWYVFGFVLFQSVIHELIDLRPRKSAHPHNVHISFAENQHPASYRTDSLGTSYAIGENIIALSTASSNADSKLEPGDSQVELSKNLDNSSQNSRRCNIVRILPPLTPSALEPGHGAQPLALNVPEEKVKV
jgi:Pheromone A receptor